MLYFEADSIRLHLRRVDAFGGRPQMVETGPAELNGTLSAENGTRGTITIPLDASECAFIREVIKAASERAISLIRDLVAV